MSSFLTTHQQN